MRLVFTVAQQRKSSSTKNGGREFRISLAVVFSGIWTPLCGWRQKREVVMPTVDKLEKYDLQRQNTDARDETSENVSKTPAKAKQSLSVERSAFSDTDLKGRLAATGEESAVNNGVLSRYSDSNIELAKLTVPLGDDSRSEASGESGLAILLSSCDRSLVSQDSVREVVPAVSNEVVEPDHNNIKSDQGKKGSVIMLQVVQYVRVDFHIPDKNGAAEDKRTIRAVYTRENKLRLTLDAAYKRREHPV